MNGDYMSKPLQGSLFEKFRSRIMGHGHILPQDDTFSNRREVPLLLFSLY